MFLKLKQKILNKTAKVSIIGVGYVGLAVTETLLNSGLNIIGYDTNADKIKDNQLLKTKNIKVTPNISEIKDCDVFVICLPTPVKQYVLPDFSFIENAFNNLAENVFKEGQLVTIESTVQPGTTRDLIVPIILNKKKNLRLGENFFIGYSPERIDPASKHYTDLREIPKLISGMTENCLLLTEIFYSQFIKNLYKTSSPEIAEFAKLFENTFRAINIAFVGEITRIANRLNMNIAEVLTAAYTKPFGIMPFWPTAGSGGHCIPVDLLYLDSWARTNDCYSQFVELSHRINQGTPYYIVQRVSKLLNEKSKSLKGSKILQIGITYKPNVSDVRSSASLKLAELLTDSEVELSVYDPYIKESDVNFKLMPNLTKQLLNDSDLVIFSVAHDCLDLDFIYKNSNCLFYCAGKPIFPNDKKINLL